MKTKILLTAAVAVALAAGQAFGQVETLMMHNPRTIWQGSQDRINQNFRYWQAKSGAACGSQCGTGCNENGCGTGCDAGCDIANSLGCDANAGCNTGCGGWQKLSGKSIWANYVGRTGEFEPDGWGNNIDFESNGIQVGLDLFSDRCTQFGVMFGYEKEKVSDIVFENEADDYYFGFYAARQLNRGYDIRGYIGYGHQKYKPDYTDNLKGNTFETTLELGRRCYLNRHLSYRPVIALDIFNNDVEADLAADGVGSITQIFARFGSDLQWTRNRFNLNGGAYYSWQINDAGRNAYWASSDQSVHIGGSVFTLTAGTTYYLNAAQTFSVFANWYGDAYVDANGSPWEHTFLVGAQYRF